LCAFAVAILIAGRGEARPAPLPPHGSGFWATVVEPHGNEIRAILAKAREALRSAETGAQSDIDPTGLERLRFYRETYRLLRYARALAPDNVDVLALLGRAADMTGQTRQAIDAYATALKLAGPEKAGAGVTGGLGAIYLRLGQLDDAVRYLEMAQGPILANNPTSANTLIDLAAALALRGQTIDAIDVLKNAIPVQAGIDYTPEMQLVKFALAVQYDRDEQRSAAYEVLDQLQIVLQGQMGPQLQVALAMVRFAPPEDEHYFRALYYEALGHYIEARAEWAQYAASGATYRARALDHVAAIDAQRHTTSVPMPHGLHARMAVP
jgi:tetratricopeptide (TPR) repeat protein